MNRRFSIFRRRTTAKRLFHRLLGLGIWSVPVTMGLYAIVGSALFPWCLAGLLPLIGLCAYGLCWYTFMEPDAVVICDDEIFTEFEGERRAVFPLDKITRITLDGGGLSLERNGQSLILADRDFTPEAWIQLKAYLRDAVPSTTIHTTKNERLTTGNPDKGASGQPLESSTSAEEP